MVEARDKCRAFVDAYFDGWNAHDAVLVARTFAPGGTYEAPTTGGNVPGADIGRIVEPLCAAFPDLSFERSAVVGDDRRWVVEWTLRGHNRGALRAGINATEKAMVLRGVDVFDVAEDGLHARSSNPSNRARRSTAMRVASANKQPPGVIALTWIQGGNEDEKERIRAHARKNVQDFMGEPGFISIVTGFTGLRGFTVTAWEDEAAMKRALGKHYAVAVKELFGEDFVASVWTSVWTPTRINRIWVRCPSCGSLEDVSDDHSRCSKCQAPMPERPSFW